MGAGNVEFHHISVMLEETVKGLVTNKEGIYVDCTLGGAGHSHRIAELLSSKGRIIGIDQDADAIDYRLNGQYYYSASGRFYNEKYTVSGTGVACVRDAYGKKE